MGAFTSKCKPQRTGPERVMYNGGSAAQPPVALGGQKGSFSLVGGNLEFSVYDPYAAGQFYNVVKAAQAAGQTLVITSMPPPPASGAYTGVTFPITIDFTGSTVTLDQPAQFQINIQLAAPAGGAALTSYNQLLANASSASPDAWTNDAGPVMGYVLVPAAGGGCRQIELFKLFDPCGADDQEPTLVAYEMDGTLLAGFDPSLIVSNPCPCEKDIMHECVSGGTACTMGTAPALTWNATQNTPTQGTSVKQNLGGMVYSETLSGFDAARTAELHAFMNQILALPATGWALEDIVVGGSVVLSLALKRSAVQSVVLNPTGAVITFDLANNATAETLPAGCAGPIPDFTVLGAAFNNVYTSSNPTPTPVMADAVFNFGWFTPAGAGGGCVEFNRIRNACGDVSYELPDGTPYTPVGTVEFGECGAGTSKDREICANMLVNGLPEIWNVIERTDTTTCGDSNVRYLDPDTSPMADVTAQFVSIKHGGRCECCTDSTVPPVVAAPNRHCDPYSLNGLGWMIPGRYAQPSPFAGEPGFNGAFKWELSSMVVNGVEKITTPIVVEVPYASMTLDANGVPSQFAAALNAALEVASSDIVFQNSLPDFSWNTAKPFVAALRQTWGGGTFVNRVELLVGGAALREDGWAYTTNATLATIQAFAADVYADRITANNMGGAPTNTANGTAITLTVGSNCVTI